MIDFKERILEALKKGGASQKDIKILNNILSVRINQVNILSAAIFAALYISAKDKASNILDNSKLENSINKIESIISKAMENLDSKKPLFDKEQRQKLVELFNDIGLDGEKAADRFISNFDALLGENIISNANILKSKMKKKSDKVETKVEKEPEKEKLTV
jgi:hypothetical protein